ncbi:MAG: hypothetical protein NTV34_10990, partial [Proteobacteria bacterium]|nr:hypothetical protein [Pseudomonadota bacterium]
VTEDSPSGELESPDDVPYVDRCIAIESFPPAASNTLELRYNPKEVVRYRDGKVHYIHNPKFPQKSSGPQGPIPGLGEWTELTCKSQAKPKGSKPKDSKPK